MGKVWLYERRQFEKSDRDVSQVDWHHQNEFITKNEFLGKKERSVIYFFPFLNVLVRFSFYFSYFKQQKITREMEKLTNKNFKILKLLMHLENSFLGIN